MTRRDKIAVGPIAILTCVYVSSRLNASDRERPLRIGGMVDGIVVAPSETQNPSAYIKIDRSIATTLRKGKPYAYPYAVECGHGRLHPAPPTPFFRRAFL